MLVTIYDMKELLQVGKDYLKLEGPFALCTLEVDRIRWSIDMKDSTTMEIFFFPLFYSIGLSG